MCTECETEPTKSMTQGGAGAAPGCWPSIDSDGEVRSCVEKIKFEPGDLASVKREARLEIGIKVKRVLPAARGDL